NERSLRTGVVSRLRTRKTSRVTLTETLGVLRHLLFQGVGSEGRQNSATTRQNTQCTTDTRTAHHCRPSFLEFLLVGVERTHLGVHADALVTQFQVSHDFGETEHTHGHDREVDTVLKLRDAEVVASNAGVHV